MSIQTEKLETATAELKGGLDGDVAVMLALLDQVTVDRQNLPEAQRLRAEIEKIKKRVAWDLIASQMGPKYTIDHYGDRP